MKFLIASLALVAVAAAVPPYQGNYNYPTQTAYSSPNQYARTLSQSQNIQPDGQYQYEYSVDNGIHAEESGYGGNFANGRASWVDPQGVPVEFSYVADENGYRATGSHVPETPSYVLRALEYIRTHPTYEDSYTTYGKTAGQVPVQKYPSNYGAYQKKF